MTVPRSLRLSYVAHVQHHNYYTTLSLTFCSMACCLSLPNFCCPEEGVNRGSEKFEKWKGLLLAARNFQNLPTLAQGPIEKLFNRC